jgi:hypothetical protein
MSLSGTANTSPAANPAWVPVTISPTADWLAPRSRAIVCSIGCA